MDASLLSSFAPGYYLHVLLENPYLLLADLRPSCPGVYGVHSTGETGLALCVDRISDIIHGIGVAGLIL